MTDTDAKDASRQSLDADKYPRLLPKRTDGPPDDALRGRPAMPRLTRGVHYGTPVEVKKLLTEVLDADTAAAMVYSLRKKIRKGNITALEFLMAYLIGRPAVVVQHGADETLAQFMAAWQQSLDNPATPQPSLPDSSPAAEDGQFRVLSSDDDAENE